MVSAEQLQKLKIESKWVDPLNETFDRFGIASPIQQGAFIGQCSHECANFRVLEENLNYRAATLMKLWPKRFPTQEVANAVAGNPQKIANTIYANRMGNRGPESGDGFRFRGRGAVQLTGADGYYFAGKALGLDLWAEPDLVGQPQYAALTAGWFWSTHKCNEVAQLQDWTKLTKIINGGTFGLNERIQHTTQAIQVIQGIA